MKTLYNTIQESLLSDIDTTLARGAYDIMLNNLFSDNIQQRRGAFEDLLSLITSYNTKQQKTTAKMKNSDSYFVQFSKSYKVKDGEVSDELMHYISYIDICKRSGPYGYKITHINASDEQFGRNINDWIERWQYARSVFKPQFKGCVLYEVPEELNELFERIQREAFKHK